MLTDVTVQLHENSVPLFVKDELEHLYESLYATLAQFQSKHDASLADVHTYVAYRAGKPCAVLLFRIHGSTARVLNEVMTIGAADIERFASHVFAKYRSVSVIAFHAIRSDIAPRVLRHRFEVSEDIVLPLPASEDEYLAALGKSTRRTVKYYSNKLKRDFPSFQHQVFTGDDITREQVRTIVDMKIAQMEEKHRPSILSEEDVDRMLRTLRSYGVVGIATVDGKVCGGWISYRVGRNDFMDMCVYDEAYHEYRLGTLCCYLAIVDCIAHGGKECHFQWGRDEYKFRFLGVQHNLVDLVIYRTPFAMIAHAGKYWRSAARHLKRKFEERRDPHTSS
ncbi:MAG TPA: GNAT family N-acetyltransferase [Noviherbaspirillum sp.]|nr:GNAT family N-acetyltransferase [Noviherbaspirillum sp.]